MTRTRRTVPAMLAAMLLLSGAAFILATNSSPTRAATPIEVDIDLGSLVPDTPVTESIVVEVPVDATVVRSEWVQLEGIATDIEWTIEMCEAGSCIDVAPPQTGQAVPAGTYDFIVTGTLVTDTLGDGYALGVVELYGDEGTTLPMTGVAIPALVVALAAGALLAGTAAVVTASRGRSAS
ncbi:hypothetical protein [Demequina sp.]|uniref:hypothetical protein n=1 Tax=Demequina sp. TaxID=2050685 RepID=UPI003A8626F7